MIWKDVVGYEGIYEVSNTGLVRTHKNKTTYSTRHKTLRYWKQRVLKQKVSKDNTHRVELYKDGKGKTWLVHRLVALAFIPRAIGKNYINHTDGDRNNNHINNLEWCNHKENSHHAFETGLIKTNKRVSLINKNTGKTKDFISMSKASSFLGKNSGYISGVLNRGKTTVDGYEILVKE